MIRGLWRALGKECLNMRGIEAVSYVFWAMLGLFGKETFHFLDTLIRLTLYVKLTHIF